MIATLAWKNLWRNKRRTLITMAAIAFGVYLTVTMVGLSTYIYGNLVDASVRMGLGHISVQPRGYQEAPTLKQRLPEAQSLAQRLRARPGVRTALPRIQGPAMFSSASKSVGGVFMAVDPSLESAETHLLLKALKQGSAFATKDARTAVVGARLAERLGLKLGRKIVLTVTDAQGEMNTALFRVGGIFKSGVDEVDGATVLLPLDSAASMLGYGPGEATAVAVLLDDARETEAAAHGLSRELGLNHAEVLPWQKTLPELSGMMRVDAVFDRIFQLVLGLVIAVGVLNTALMSVLERRREMGVMLALGLAPRSLFALMLAESAWVGALGLLLGSLISLPWYYYLAHTGLDMRSLMPPEGVAMAGILVDPVYHAKLYGPQVAAIAGVVLTLSAAAGLFPAWKAARLPPVESIRDL